MPAPVVAHLLLALADGGVAVMLFVADSRASDGIVRTVTDENVVAEITASGFFWNPQNFSIPPGIDASRVAVSWSQIDPATDLPPDRSFRGAWKHAGGIKGAPAVAVDMTRAKAIQLARIRVQRDAAFAPLDAAAAPLIAKAVGGDQPSANQLANIDSQRQVLRDLTTIAQPALDAAATPADLLAAVAFVPDAADPTVVASIVVAGTDAPIAAKPDPTKKAGPPGKAKGQAAPVRGG